MISYDRSSGLRWLWVALSLGGAVALVAAWHSWRVSPDAGNGPAVAASGPLQAPVVNLGEPVPVLPDGRPSDFSAQEWGAMKQALGNKPDGAKELARVSAYIRYQKGFEQWQALQQSGNVKERKVLANQLLEQLPERLRNMEMTMGESLMVCSALLADIEPDETVRVRRLEECKANLEKLAPRLDTEQDMREAECRTEFLRRQAALVSAFQSSPDGQRDHARFEKDLEAERRAVFDSPTCGR